MKGKKIVSFVFVLSMLLSIVLPRGAVEAATVKAFNDVKSSDWYYTDVMYARQIGLMKGDGNNTFKPNHSMDISTFVQLLMNSLKIDYSNASSTITMPKHISKALQEGILNKGEFTNYKKAITRGEMFRLLNRVIKKRNIEVDLSLNKSQVVAQIMDYFGMSTAEKEIAYTVYGSGIVRLNNDGEMGFNQNATRAEITSALIRLAHPTYRVLPTLPQDLSDTMTVEEFTTLLLKAVDKTSTMKSAYAYGYVRAEADYPSYDKPILRREAALTVARLMDDVIGVDNLFTRGDDDVFIKGIPSDSYPDDADELFEVSLPVWKMVEWENYRGNISDIYQITEEYQKEMVTLYIAGFMEVDEDQELRPYDFLTETEATALINHVKEFASLNPREAQEKLMPMIRSLEVKALPSVTKPSNAKMWGETYPYVNTSLYEYVQEIYQSWGNYTNRYLYNKNSDSLRTYPQVFKNYLNTRYTVDYRTINSKSDYYSTFNNKGGMGNYLSRVLFFYNPASVMNLVQANHEDTPRKDWMFPDDVMKQEVANIKNNKIVMQAEAVTHKSLLYHEEADQILVTLRTIYYPETNAAYLKSKGLEAGVWYEQDIVVSMVISTDGPEAKRDRWENSLLGTPFIHELSPIRKMN